MPPPLRRSPRLAPRLTLALLLACAVPPVRLAQAAPPTRPPASTQPGSAASSPAHKNPPPKPPNDAPDKADRREKARGFFLQGVAHADAGRWADAYAALAAAWKLTQHWQIAYQLARAEVSTGHILDALQHLHVALSATDKLALQSGQKFRDLLDEARGRLAYLRVMGPPHGTLVFVDGEERGTLPLAGPLGVDPGEREIVLRLGERTTSTRIVATSGQTAQARLDFPRQPADAAPAPLPSVPAATPAPDRVPLVFGLAGIFLGAAGAVAGGILWTQREENRARYDDLLNAPASPFKELSLAQLSADASAQATGAAIVWGSAGAIALGGIGYWLYASLTPSSSPQPATLTFVPAISPDRAGLTLVGTW